MLEAPPLNWDLSPYTGWTRSHWVDLLARVTYGFTQRLVAAGSPARVLYPDDRAERPDVVDGLESFARLAVAWGLWLHNPANPSSLTYDGHALDVPALLARGLLDGTQPDGPYYWGAIEHMDQRIVEAGSLALAVLLSRDRVWACLSAAEQRQIMAWLAQVDGKGTYPDNWVLFPAICQAVRLRLGYPAPEADLRRRLEQMRAFYRGDGWCVDGPGDEWDLYNAWMFGYHYLFWAWIDGDRFPDLREEVLHRARSFQAGFVHFFGANGVYVPWGRSLGSRFGAVGTFALGRLLGIAPEAPGMLRRLSSGCLKYFYERGLFHPREHYFTQGFHGHNPAALESYVSPGSPNSALQGLLALTLDPHDEFWTATEQPLPVERADFELVLPTPGFVVSGQRATGQVTLLNSRGGHVDDVARAHYPPKYGKLAYSTHFPPNVIPAAGSYAPDGMVALARNGAFSHRVLSRQGGAAPGLAWAQFDQPVAGEPQPMWTATLLWGDAQVVVAHIEPTRPVQAYYAPAALGTNQPAGLVRRSDTAQGWEYAQVDGHALAVRRLLGYTAQAPSAPFAGQANLNVAYPYAEQPLVYETEPSVAARALAAVSVARPAPFDPGLALHGFVVEAGANGRFDVRFPNEERAAVVLSNHLAGPLEVAGVRFAGPAVRYARVAPDRLSYAASGADHVEGVGSFASAAMFRLWRISPREVRVLTNSAFRLDPAWLGRGPWRLSVRALTEDWVPIETNRPREVAPPLLAEWQARHERTLIEFRLNR